MNDTLKKLLIIKRNEDEEYCDYEIRKIIHAIKYSPVGALIVCIIFWIGGFNFNERSSVAALCASLSIIAMFTTFAIINTMND